MPPEPAKALPLSRSATSLTSHLAFLTSAFLLCPTATASDTPSLRHVEPLLARYCFECHADGAEKGGFSLDSPTSLSLRPEDHSRWLAVWENARAHLMPPPDQAQPSPEERQSLLTWIERSVFHLDPARPDPGRVTLRRLNREEYQHTILDLFQHHFQAGAAFPPDDAGQDFINNAASLTLSPLLLEKYLAAAQQIARDVVPTGPHPPTLHLSASLFRGQDDTSPDLVPLGEARHFTHRFPQPHPGPFRLSLEFSLPGAEEETDQTAELILHLNGAEILREFLAWGDSEPLLREAPVTLLPGENVLTLTLSPRSPAREDQPGLSWRLHHVRLHGPLDGSRLVYPPHYERIFLHSPPPADAASREAYASQLLAHWGRLVLRRPLDPARHARLASLIRESESLGLSFEEGFARALSALLASPRFLFRAEALPPGPSPHPVVPLDDFALASRLSYSLWISTPDQVLLDLAANNQLRPQFAAQVDRMIEDPRFLRFVESFTGQWLLVRNLDLAVLNPRAILPHASPAEADQLHNHPVRQAMRQETQLLFLHLLRENRPALELLTADYAFLNEDLARLYAVPAVTGPAMRLTSLPSNSPRRGLLGQATFLTVTSHPTRTSPVNRGLFILENLLGLPSPPAPADIPPLEEIQHQSQRPLSMRESLEAHRAQPQCAGCHARFDPLGLALENFNALGQWRLLENGLPIDASGRLPTGESFTGPADLIHILATSRRRDFHRCLTEKLLAFLLGRAVEYYDAPTIDAIVDRLGTGDGLRSLLHHLLASPAFQQTRNLNPDSSGPIP